MITGAAKPFIPKNGDSYHEKDHCTAAESFGLYGAYEGFGNNYDIAFKHPNAVSANDTVYLLEAAGLNGVTCSATYDNVMPITLPTATWAGHQFNGWYTAASGGTKVGNAGES